MLCVGMPEKVWDVYFNFFALNYGTKNYVCFLCVPDLSVFRNLIKTIFTMLLLVFFKKRKTLASSSVTICNSFYSNWRVLWTGILLLLEEIRPISCVLNMFWVKLESFVYLWNGSLMHYSILEMVPFVSWSGLEGWFDLIRLSFRGLWFDIVLKVKFQQYLCKLFCVYLSEQKSQRG